MASIWSGHFDSTPDDERLMTAETWASYLRSFISNGIRGGGRCLQVVADGSLDLRIMCPLDKNNEPYTAVAHIEGYIYMQTPDISGDHRVMTAPQGNPSAPRIDRLILRLDRSIPVRSIEAFIISGKAGSNPAAPVLSQDRNGVYEICLAEWPMPAGATGIPAGSVIDRRYDQNLCGIINSILGLDSSVWQKQFDAFMAAIKAQDTAFLAAQLKQFNDWKQNAESDWNNYFGSVQASLPTYAGFDGFDNQFLYPNTDKTTTLKSDGGITTTLNTTGGLPVAKRETVKNANGTISVTETVYASDNKTVLWTRTKNTTRSGSTIKETV